MVLCKYKFDINSLLNTINKATEPQWCSYSSTFHVHVGEYLCPVFGTKVKPNVETRSVARANN